MKRFPAGADWDLWTVESYTPACYLENPNPGARAKIPLVFIGGSPDLQGGGQNCHHPGTGIPAERG